MKRRIPIYCGRMIFTVIIISLMVPFAGFGQVVSSDYSFYIPPDETTPYPLVEPVPVKNVILMIGDGMSMAHIASARIAALGADGKLFIERMPVTGIINTHEVDELVSGSAATATSLATGYKTRGGMIGVLPDGTPAYTILEAARDRGMSTGLVATVTITHATPAAFASHVLRRGMENQIAVGILESRVDVILGGGRALFRPGVPGYEMTRTDGRDLIKEAQEAGYEYVETKEELRSAAGNYLLGLFSGGILRNRESEPSLAEMTEKALDIVSRNENGFFLMVEGSQIDWGAHDNDFQYTIREQLHFDLAIKTAVEFASENGETLVVITADHETGGLLITEEPRDPSEGKINIQWGTDGHTGTPIPVFAFGPYAERFGGWYDNTDIPKKIAQILGISPFPRKIESTKE